MHRCSCSGSKRPDRRYRNVPDTHARDTRVKARGGPIVRVRLCNDCTFLTGRYKGQSQKSLEKSTVSWGYTPKLSENATGAGTRVDWRYSSTGMAALVAPGKYRIRAPLCNPRTTGALNPSAQRA
jgi:hypothetical protein